MYLYTYLGCCADEWSIKRILCTVVTALILKTRGILGDTMEFRCTSYEVHSSYMNATGYNNKGAGCEIDKFLPSSEFAHRLDDVIELM